MASSASRGAGPLIGLSAAIEPARYGVWEETVAFVPDVYLSAITRAGGGAVLLPPMPFGPARVLEALDGLVLTGGRDVDPRLYGAEAHDRTDAPGEERDAWELSLCRAALDMDLPLLAVCRGLQVLNVCLGGTLHQHLPEIVGHDSHRASLGQMSPNQVTLEPGTAVASVMGSGTRGLCHHHQALDRLGSGLLAVGHAADGTVEAVEVTGKSFALGVQWHPEEDASDARLFAALVAAAAERTAGRAVAGPAMAHPAPR